MTGSARNGDTAFQSLIAPDRVQLDTHQSLVATKSWLDKLPASRIQKLLSLYGPLIVDRQLALENQVSLAPSSAILLGAAADSEFDFVVGHIGYPHGFKIVPSAFEKPIRGFLAWDTVEWGLLSVIPSLMRHNSLEAKLEGGPIFVELSRLEAAIGQRPTSAAKLEEVSLEIIAEAVASGRCLKKDELVHLIRSRKEIQGLSNRRILKVAWPLAPDEWKRPGPKRLKL